LDAEDKSTLTTITETSRVTAWRDKSVLSNNTTSYGGNPSVTSSINGRKAMYFDGSSYLTGSISAASSTTITIFLVGSLIAPFGVFSGLLCFGNPSQFDYDNDGSLPITMYIDQYKIYGARNSSSQPTPISANVPFMYVLQYDGSYINTWKNGTIQTDPSSNISKSGTFTYTHYAVGSRAGTILGAYLWSGYIGEIIVYQSPVTAFQRQEIEGYLAWKWGLNSSLSNIHPFKPIRPYLRIFQPTDIPSCALWLDGSDKSSMTLSGSNVTQWNDKSGNGYNFVTQGSFAPPVISNNAISTKSAVSFTGNTTQNDSANQILTNSSFPLNSSTEGYSIFVVSKQNSSHPSWSGYNYLVSAYGGGAGNGLIYGTTYSNYLITANGTAGPISGFNDLSDNVPNTLMTSTTQTGMVVSGSVLTPYLNGVAMTTKTGTCVALTGISIGNAYAPGQSFTAQTWGGLICEVFIYNSALTTAQRQQVEGYLAWKWGLQTSLSNIHPFYKFRSSTALPFSPKNISGLSLWLDANDPAGTGTQPSAGALATWVDKSGSSNDMTAVSTAPSFLNAPPGVVIFDGSGYYSNSNPVLSNVYTLFITYVSSETYTGPLYTTGASSGYSGLFPNEGGNLYLTRGDSTWYSSSTMLPNNQLNLVSISYSANEVGSNISLYYNGSNSITTTQSNTITYSNFLLGSRQSGGTSSFYGVMLEVIAYNGTLTTHQRQSVEGYLAQKWKL
jgi:hypothetical protein